LLEKLMSEEEIIAFSHTQGLDCQPSNENFPTLRSGGGGHAVMVAAPIQDGREMEKNQNGLGVASPGSPSYTLDSTGAQAVATWWDGGQISQTLDAVLAKGQTMPDKNRFPAVIQESRVRRLTPIEAERLQGFPDNWTDLHADTNRYKQMGNAVTVDVVAWIASRL
jgi:site-specific DNA-cytosine methylase